MQHQELTEAIIGCAMQVHSVLGPGFLESVYKRALAYELHKTGLQVEREKPVSVHYDGIPVGDFSVDLLVNGSVLVELKANHAISPANEVQLGAWSLRSARTMDSISGPTPVARQHCGPRKVELDRN